MPVTRNNIVRFRFGPDFFEDTIPLTLTGEWVVSGGMQPNCNTAIVPIEDYNKLDMGNYAGGRVGEIEFWWTSSVVEEEQPDHVIGGIWLIDAQPELIGKRRGEVVNAIQAMRLCFADHRHAFVEPRGGRLNQGELNPTPKPTTPGYTLKTNAQLMNLCQTAMGLSASVPSSVDDVDPARDLNWLGDHAPGEFAKLLEHTGHVYGPHSSGLGFVLLPGFGALPTILPALLSYSLASSAVDRRPAKTIFYSAPTPAIRTYDGNAAAWPLWEFVAQDHADGFRWKRLAEIPSLGGTSSAANFQYRRGFPAAPPQYRDHYKRQVYKCLRLNATAFDPRRCPVMKRVHWPDGSVYEPHLVAEVATQASDSAWVNGPGMLKVKTVVSEENVLVFDQYLGTVTDGEKPDQSSYFAPLTEATIKVTFSVEDWDATRLEKKFFVSGYTTSGGVATAMVEATARDHLTGNRPDTAIYQCPELRLVVLNDVTDNRTELNATTLKYAQRLIASTALAPRVMEVAALYPMNLSGRVSEIRWSQSECKTTIIIDGWNFPSFTPDDSQQASAGRGGEADARNPNRQASRSSRSARERGQIHGRKDGSSSVPDRSHVVTPETPPPSGLRPIYCKPTSKVGTVRGFYNARSYSGKLNVNAAGPMSEALLGQLSPTDDLLLWNPTEINDGGAQLPLNVPLAAQVSTLNDAGKLIAIASVGAGGMQAIRLNTAAGYIQTTFAVNPTEDQWQNAIAVNSCPTSAARTLFGPIGDSTPSLRRDSSMEDGMKYSKPRTPSKIVVDADVTLDGADAVEIFQADATNGSALQSVEIIARGETRKGVIRFWHQPGGSGDKVLLRPFLPVDARETQLGQEPWSASWRCEEQDGVLLLGPSDKVYISLWNAESFFVRSVGIDLTT